MDEVLAEIRNWFLAKRNEILVFAQQDSRLEGWFKGEMLVLLDQLKNRRVISDFRREATVTHQDRRYQIDFVLVIGEAEHLIELKAPCISQAKGTPRNLNFYFANDNLGVIKDMRKLDLLEGARKWLIAFIYPKPEDAEWANATARIPGELDHWHCITTLADFPDYLYISVWTDLV